MRLAWALGMALLVTLLGAVLGGSQAWAEAWAAAFTGPWAASWASLQAVFPMPVLPWLAGFWVLLAVAWGRHRPWRQQALIVLTLGLVAVASFQIAWGFHAGRPSGLERYGLTAKATPTEADQVAARLAAQLRSGRSEPFDLPGALVASGERLEGMTGVTRLPPETVTVPGWLFGPLDLAGVVSPWTYEVHVNGGLPAWAQAAVVAHERAHLAGFASEQDAEWVGAVAGLTSGHPDAAYAAALWMWIKAPADLRAQYDPGPTARADIEALREALARYDAFDARWAWRIYDAWLRSRGDTLGTAGYAAGFDALVRAHAGGWW